MAKNAVLVKLFLSMVIVGSGIAFVGNQDTFVPTANATGSHGWYKGWHQKPHRSTRSNYCGETEVKKPDLKIEKSGPATVVRGNTITYKLKVTNIGQATAENVEIKDVVPTGLIYQAPQSDPDCTLQGTTISCDFDELDPGMSDEAIIVMLAPEWAVCNEVVVENKATVSCSSTDSNASNNTSNVVKTTITCPAPKLGCVNIVKEAYDENGTKLSTVPPFVFKMDNSTSTTTDSTGKARIDNVPVGSHTITEVVPTGWELTSVSPSNGTVNVTEGASCANVTFKNKQVTTPKPDLTIKKTGVSSVVRGNAINYSLTVENIGTATAANVIITDPVPSGVSFQSAQSDSRCSLSGNNVVCNIGSVDAGKTVTVALSFMTPAADNACTTMNVDNKATVTTSSVEFNTSNNESNKVSTTVTCPVVQTGCIEITKEAYDPNNVKLTTVPQFTFKLDNNASTVNNSSGQAGFLNVPVGSHTITEVVPSGWEQVSVTPSNGVVTVVAGQSCANVTFKNKQVVTTVQKPDLTIQKSGPTTVVRGNTVSYQLIVQNIGQAAAEGVIVTDTVPTGVAFKASQSDSRCTLQGTNVVCSLGTVSVNQTVSIALSFEVPTMTTACTTATINNVASVTSSTSETTTSNNVSNTVTTQITCPTTAVGCIDILKEAFDTNSNRIYSVPQFTFKLDNNASVSNDSNGNARFNNVPVGTHTISELSQSGWEQINVTPSNGTVTVSAGSSCAGVVFKNKQISSSTTPNFSISKTDGESEVEPGDELTYTITVRNNSGFAVKNVTIYDDLPNDVEFIDCSDDCDEDNDRIIWEDLDFDAYEEMEFEIEVQVDDDADDGDTLKNVACVEGYNKCATDETDVEDDDDDDDDDDVEIDLTKEASSYEVLPGGIVEYTVRIKNTGDSTIEDLTVEDTLPNGVIVVDDGDSDKRSGSKLTWEIDSLKKNATWTVRYRVSVSTSAFPGTLLRNEACASDDDEIDECVHANVSVIGNLPQTGVTGGLNGGLSAHLKPIFRDQGGNVPFAPLGALVSIIGLGVSAGIGLGKRFI